MKQTTFTFLLFAVVALVSCKKNNLDQNITQYDDEQIRNYMTANSLTGLTKDSSGMYYQMLTTGKTDSTIQYSSLISMVFSIKSLDGAYVSSDTISNHYYGYAGHLTNATSPIGLSAPGLQAAIHNILKHPGASMRLLVPSHLGYGVDGAGVGSSSLSSGRIAGNQSLDYFVHVIYDQDAYDQASIKKYLAENSLTTYQQDASGFWYSISEPGTGTVAITDNSTVAVTYTVTLLNGTTVDSNTTGASFDIPDVIPGVSIALKKYATTGALMSILIPTKLGYGASSTGIPSNSIIKYDVRIVSVSP